MYDFCIVFAVWMARWQTQAKEWTQNQSIITGQKKENVIQHINKNKGIVNHCIGYI